MLQFPCLWGREQLKSFFCVQDFMNGVCTNIISMEKRRLLYYSGNYDAFVKTRTELLEHQMKRYKCEQAQLSHLKDFVARFGHGQPSPYHISPI